MKITKSQLKQLVKEEIEEVELQEQEVMTVQKQLEYLARNARSMKQEIYDLNIRMTELEKGV